MDLSLRSLTLKRGWLAAAAVGVLVVGLVIGILIGAGMGSGASASHVGEIVQVVGASDQFNRPDDAFSLGAQPGGLRWRADVGRWGVLGEKAAATLPGPDRSFAVIPVDRGDGAVQVRLDKVTDGAGLVFRYRDPRNFWSLVAAPRYATWSLTKTIGGLSSGAATTGLTSTRDGTTIAVRMKGDIIDVVVGGRVRKTITDRSLRHEALGGLTVAGDAAALARFDDMHAARSGNRPLLPSATVPAVTAPTATAPSPTATAPTTAPSGPRANASLPPGTSGPPVPSSGSTTAPPAATAASTRSARPPATSSP